MQKKPAFPCSPKSDKSPAVESLVWQRLPRSGHIATLAYTRAHGKNLNRGNILELPDIFQHVAK